MADTLRPEYYQSVKGMTAAEATCKSGGVIIIASECCDGHGGEAFYDWFKHSSGPRDVMDKIIKHRRDETVPDQWEAQVLARILIKHRVIMVTDRKNHGIVEDMYMTPASTIDEALDIAENTAGKNSSITVIPDGISVIVR
jgi:nickel-dependent lactate racemase